MAWSIEDRRSWLFPPVSGVVDGIDLAHLDPSDPDDRHLLISFEHPGLDEAIESGMEEVVLDGEVMNPRMHVTLHEVVANQIWDGEPEVTWRTAERLTKLGYGSHDVLHMIAWVVGIEIHASLQEQRLHRPDLMAKGLAGLPKSWEGPRPDSATVPASDESTAAIDRRRPGKHPGPGWGGLRDVRGNGPILPLRGTSE